MTVTYVPPSPSCGHGGVTFTHDVDRELWLCPLCLAALGGLIPHCTRCGRALRILNVRFVHRTCLRCQRELAAAQRAN